MTRRASPSLEGSLSEWKAGDIEVDDWAAEKGRRFLWATVPPAILAAGITGFIGYGKAKLTEAVGSEDAAMIMTKIALLGVPTLSTATGLLLMMGMHIAEKSVPLFIEEIKPFGPRKAPEDDESWEEWLYKGVRVGRWQSMDGTGRPGAIARIPIMDENVLIAARHRMGKSTVLWAIMEDLQEAIDQGVVRVIMFDAKNGLEMSACTGLGYVAEKDFFFGENVGEINPETQQPFLYEETFIKPFEDLVLLMRKRAAKVRPTGRRHHAVPGDPQILVIIDEMAALIRETTPGPVKRRIENAVMNLEQQGAACGITVIGATQHPSIDEIGPIRNGLTYGVCGSVKSPKAPDMVLGEGSRRLGSKADKLPRRIPGVFYSSESGPLVFRACHAGPEFDFDDFEPDEIEVTEDDQKQADRMWARIRMRRNGLRKAA